MFDNGADTHRQPRMMTRSKTQVIYNGLPGQVMLHDDGYLVKVHQVRTRRAQVPEMLLLETLGTHLERWPERAGFPDPRRTRDKYEFVEPVDDVVVDLWPLTLQCSRSNCHAIKVFNTLDDFLADPHPERCHRPGCGGRREQLEFMMVHYCGKAMQLRIGRCPQHDQDHLVFDDTGSFGTAQLRCMMPGCNGTPVSGMGFRRCDCQMYDDDRAFMVSVTVRAPNRHSAQQFPFVALEGRRIERMRSEPGGAKVCVGAYLGLFDEVEEALDQAKQQVKGDPQKWGEMEEALRKSGIADELIAQQRALYLGEAHGAFKELDLLVPAHVVDDLGRRQKCCERALIFGRSRDMHVDTLDTLAERADKLGQQAAVNRLRRADGVLRERKFSKALVVSDFPIALVAYGYTRLTSDPQKAKLNAFAPTRKQSAKKPLYVSATNTEAVFLELDPPAVRDWVQGNGFDSAFDIPAGHDARAVKAWFLCEAYAASDAYQRVELLCHTLAHALTRNLGARAGFGEDTMAEYVIPEMLTIGLYASTHQEFTLGALVSLVEHNLVSWLNAVRDGAETCTWDPVCRETDGACAGCLHLAFGCERGNQALDRAVLFGSDANAREERPDISRGFWE